MSNEINITINVSDELLNKVMTVMLASANPMPMLAGIPLPAKVEKKAPIGFQSKGKDNESR